MPAPITPRLRDRSARPGESIQRPAPPGPVSGIQSKRKPLARPAPMAPTQLYYDIPPSAIGPGELQQFAVTNDHLEVGSVTARNIQAGSITADAIAAGSITGDKIAANTITAANIAADTITATEIAANAITASELAAGAVTATKINVSQLSAITADMGTLTAGTIQGGVIQTGAANPRVVINPSGIRMTAADGTITFDAASATGVLTLGNPAGARIQFDPTLAVNSQLYLQGRLVGTGSIMGPSFLTGLTNPRIVIDAYGINAYPAPSFPSVGVLDDFNRANTGPPPSANWEADLRSSLAPGLAVVSNQARSLTGTEASIRWTNLFATDDNEAYATIQADQRLELWARHTKSASPTGYVLYYDTATHMAKLQRYGPGGSPGWVAITGDVAVPFAAGMSFGIRCVGSQITGWYRPPGGAWTQILTVADTTFATGKQIGVLVYSTAAIVDDFGGGDYVAGSALPSFTVDGFTGSVTATGGTFTGGVFRTAAAGARVEMSGNRLALYDGSANRRVDVNAATGTLDLLFGSGVTSTLRWVDSGGVVYGQTGYANTLGVGPSVLQSYRGQLTLIANAAGAGSTAKPDGQLWLWADSADSEVTILCEGTSFFTTSLKLHASNVLTNQYSIWQTGDSSLVHAVTLQGGTATPAIKLDVGNATSSIDLGWGNGTDIVRYRNGKLIGTSGELWVSGSKAAFMHKVGVTCWAAAVNGQYGQYDNFKQVRTDILGNLVTPASGTFSGSPYSNLRTSAVGVGTIHADGLIWNLAASATGAIVQYFNVMTMA